MKTLSDQANEEEEKKTIQKPQKKRGGRKWALFMLLAHALGFVSSFHALMSTRTSQGAIAWIVSLNAIPIVSVPAYWVFGRDKFQGYITIRQQMSLDFDSETKELREKLTPFIQNFGDRHGAYRAAETIANLPYFNSNAVELLINGKNTFESLFAGIDQAEKYILVQFYIIHDDDLGQLLQKKLIAKAKSGVKVYLLYDEIGSGNIDDYVQTLRDGGVEVSAFHSTQGGGNRFQLNFRNHRKIVVVDGKYEWIGGHNVGDEYLGDDTDFPHWRDTHMKITGPATLQLQLSFIEDWNWAKNEHLDIEWEPVAAPEGNASVLVFATGPADRLETCSLMYQQAIHASINRIWIASPYFVPDEAVMSALHLAALRGVDVKILIPDEPDSQLVYYSAYAFVGELIESEVEIYRYEPGFLHEKVFLVDDHLAGVGTANFDNRSFRLNFEITALVVDKIFVNEVETMFQNDFEHSHLMTIEDVKNKPGWFKVLSRASYLTAPVQ